MSGNGDNSSKSTKYALIHEIIEGGRSDGKISGRPPKFSDEGKQVVSPEKKKSSDPNFMKRFLEEKHREEQNLESRPTGTC